MSLAIAKPSSENFLPGLHPDLEILVNFDTPSTRPATELPNFLDRTNLFASESSITSCNRAAEIVSLSIFISASVLATAVGCVIYACPLRAFDPHESRQHICRLLKLSDVP